MSEIGKKGGKTNEKEAKVMLTSAGLTTFTSMREAVTEAVKHANK